MLIIYKENETNHSITSNPPCHTLPLKVKHCFMGNADSRVFNILTPTNVTCLTMRTL